MHVYLITFITVFYRLPGRSGASRAQTKQKEQTFPRCLLRGAATVSTRREEQILGWWVTLEEGFWGGIRELQLCFPFCKGLWQEDVSAKQRSICWGGELVTLPLPGIPPHCSFQSFQHEASALQLVYFAFWVKNFHPELKMALEHYGFCCFLSLCRQIELCPSPRNDGFNFLSVGNTQKCFCEGSQLTFWVVWFVCNTKTVGVNSCLKLLGAVLLSFRRMSWL